jgi:hypothetical protein
MPGLTGGELGAHYEELQTQFKDLISTSNQVKKLLIQLALLLAKPLKD